MPKAKKVQISAALVSVQVNPVEVGYGISRTRARVDSTSAQLPVFQEDYYLLPTLKCFATSDKGERAKRGRLKRKGNQKKKSCLESAKQLRVGRRHELTREALAGLGSASANSKWCRNAAVYSFCFQLC